MKASIGTNGTLTYNAYGWRVYNSSGSLSYLYDPSGQFIMGSWANGAGWNAGIFFGGRQLAMYGGNSVYFPHANTLGSDTQTTDWAGNGGQAILYYPLGQVWSESSQGFYPGTVYQRFASLQLYDTSTDGYVPPFRYYVPEQGRWLTPDLLAGDIMNPQSLNRYGYVNNNPTSLIDPFGLDPRGGGDPCGRNPFRAVCGGDAASSAAACLQAGLTPNCAGPLGSGELGAAEAQYLTNNNLCPAFCGGFTYTQAGLKYSWVPGTFSQNGQVIAVSTGYWGATFGVQAESIGGAGFTPQGGSGPGQIETLAKGLNALTTPFQNIAVSGGLFLAGAGTIVAAAVATDAVCAATAAAGPLGWAGCGAFTLGIAVPVAIGGEQLLETGYQYTKQVTIPSITNFGR